MDEADRATDIQARALEADIAAARGVPAKARTHCSQCHEPLDPHRVRYGVCYLCQTRIEAQYRRERCGS
jgi:hypothetical protein